MSRSAILVAVALSFSLLGACSKQKCKARQSQAQTGLRAIFTAQKSYHQEAKPSGMSMSPAPATYASSMDKLEWKPSPDMKHYAFKIVSASADAFVAEATGQGEMAGDVWRVDQTGTVSASANKCE